MVQGILNYILKTNQSNQGIVKDRICGKYGNMGNNFIDIPQTSKMLENENIREFSLQEKYQIKITVALKIVAIQFKHN